MRRTARRVSTARRLLILPEGVDCVRQGSYVLTVLLHLSPPPGDPMQSYPELFFLRNAYPAHTHPQSKQACATNAPQGRAARVKERTSPICADLVRTVPPMTAL